MAPVFSHGDLRLYLLSLLDESPRHGYDLMQALSDRTGGTCCRQYLRLGSSCRQNLRLSDSKTGFTNR